MLGVWEEGTDQKRRMASRGGFHFFQEIEELGLGGENQQILLGQGFFIGLHGLVKSIKLLLNPKVFY